MSNFHSVLSELHDRSAHLSNIDRERLFDCVNELRGVIEELEGIRNSQIDVLNNIRSYLKKKRRETHIFRIQGGNVEGALRQLRNELAHGGTLRRYDRSERRKIELALWRNLEKSSPFWEPEELSKLLAYCLRSNIPLSNVDGAEPRKIVRVYKAIYETLTDEDKDRAFTELVLRLFSEVNFRNALGEGK